MRIGKLLHPHRKELRLNFTPKDGICLILAQYKALQMGNGL